MNEIEFIESDMKFIFQKDSVINLERTDLYKNKLSGKGIKICDFIVLANNMLNIIEVKSSVPKNLKEYCQNIKTKINDSLLLISAIHLKRHKIDSDIKNFLTKENLSKKTRAILIVDEEKQYLPMLQNALNKEMNSLNKLFSLEQTFVLNLEVAKKKKINVGKLPN